jgi:hypothetical protein
MEALGARLPRFRHDHREAAVSEVGGDVGTADGALDPLTGGEGSSRPPSASNSRSPRLRS